MIGKIVTLLGKWAWIFFFSYWSDAEGINGEKYWLSAVIFVILVSISQTVYEHEAIEKMKGEKK